MADVIDLSTWKDDRAEARFQSGWHFIGGAQLDQELPPENFLVHELGITSPGVTIIGGGGFGGKTMTMQSLALSVASGQPLWGHYEVRQGKAVHLDWEQGKLTVRRYQRLARAMGISLTELGDALTVSCLPTAYLDSDDAESSMVRICEGASVCLIDAFRGAFPSAQENDSGVRKYLDMLRHVSEATECAIIVIAHSRKMSADTDVRSSLRGSGALFDAADTVYMLDAVKGKPTQIHNTKDRVLGETRDTFGLSIEDVMSPICDDRRWGLNVRYLAPCEVQAAYLETDDRDDNRIAMSAERLISCARRVIPLIGSDGVTATMIRAMTQDNALDLRAVIEDLLQRGTIRQDGTGTHALYFRSANREPGDD